MGMFSWKCKGCSAEICCPELVRIEGLIGAYDGYGRVTNEDSDLVWQYGGWTEDGRNEPDAWHVVCFLKASDEKQKDVTPSDNAPNQGFGCAQDRFMPPPEWLHPHDQHGWKLADKFEAKLGGGEAA